MKHTKNLQTTRVDLGWIKHDYEPSQVISRAEKMIALCDSNERVNDQNRTIANAVAVNEINSGILMCESLREIYRAFSIQFKRDVENEHECKTVTQKALAEVMAINFSRILDLQKRITEYLSGDQISLTGVKYFQSLSKELDRAQRHFATSTQQLQATKYPPIQISIKATSAIVGHNQLVQINQ